MKKRSRLLLAGVVLAAALSIGALAADEPVKGGIYDLKPGQNVTLTPQTESLGTITPTTDGDKTGYYANAVRMGVEATGLESGKQYLLLVLSGTGAPTEGNIAYIDQAAAGADGSISFHAYPSALTSGTYRVYIVGGSRAFSAGPAATFQVDQKYTLGDVDNDGYWTANDALYTLQIAVNKTTIKINNVDTPVTENMRLSADTDKDTYVTANDALLILQKAVGKNVF